MNHPPLEQDPAIYLRQQPSSTSPCHILVEQIDSHDGAPAPMHMLAKVAVRLHALVDWAARWDGREKLAKRAAAFLVALALGNVAVIAKSWIHAHDERIEAEAAARATKTQIERIEQEIRDLRRVCGIDPQPISIVQREVRP